MNIFFDRSQVIVFNLLFLTYLVVLLFPFPGSNTFISILSVFALVLALFRTNLVYKIIIAVAMILSLILMVKYNLFSVNAVYYFSSMTNILVLIAYASIISIPVILGVYPRKIYSLFQSKIKSFKGIYTMYSSVTFLLCSVMTVAAIPTIQTSLSNFLRRIPEEFQKKFLTITFIRPFIGTLFWTPVAVAPAVVITGTGSNPIIVLSITFSIAILFLLIDIQTCAFRFRNEHTFNDISIKSLSDSNATKKLKHSLALFVFSIILFCTIILFTSKFFHFTLIDAVVLTVIPFSLIWSMTLKRTKRFFTRLKEHFKNNVPKTAPQISLFIAIGFFINVLEQTPISDQINSLFLSFEYLIGPFVLAFIGLVTFLLTWIGIIPQLVVVLVIQTINFEILGFVPEWFAIAVLGSALAGSASSPFALNANVVAVTIKDTPFNVVKRNLFYALSILIFTNILAICLQLFFPI